MLCESRWEQVPACPNSNHFGTFVVVFYNLAVGVDDGSRQGKVRPQQKLDVGSEFLYAKVVVTDAFIAAAASGREGAVCKASSRDEAAFFSAKASIIGPWSDHNLTTIGTRQAFGVWVAKIVPFQSSSCFKQFLGFIRSRVFECRG